MNGKGNEIAIIIIDVDSTKSFANQTLKDFFSIGNRSSRLPNANDLCLVIASDDIRNQYQIVCPGLPFSHISDMRVSDLWPTEISWEKMLRKQSQSQEDSLSAGLAVDLWKLRSVMGNSKAPIRVYSRSNIHISPGLVPVLSSGLITSRVTIDAKPIHHSVSAHPTQRVRKTATMKRPDASAQNLSATSVTASRPSKTNTVNTTKEETSAKTRFLLMSAISMLFLAFWSWILIISQGIVKPFLAPRFLMTVANAVKHQQGIYPLLIAAVYVLFSFYIPKVYSRYFPKSSVLEEVIKLLALNLGYILMTVQFYVLDQSRLLTENVNSSVEALLCVFFIASIPSLLLFAILPNDINVTRKAPSIWETSLSLGNMTWKSILALTCLSGVIPLAIGKSICESIPQLKVLGISDSGQASIMGYGTLIVNGQTWIGIAACIVLYFLFSSKWLWDEWNGRITKLCIALTCGVGIWQMFLFLPRFL